MADQQPDDNFTTIHVPTSYKRQRERQDLSKSDVADFLRENEERAQEMFKSLPTTGEGPARFPNKFVELFAKLGYYNGVTEPEQATQKSYAILKKCADALLVEPIISTRARQLKQYCHPSEDENQPGFQIVLRNPEDKPSQGDRDRMQKIADWLLDGGFRTKRPWDGAYAPWSADFVFQGMSLGDLVAAFSRDSLALDAGAIWLPPGKDDAKAPVALMYPLDGALIRKTIPDIPAFREASEGAGGNAWTGAPAVGMSPYEPQLRERQKIIEHVMVNPEHNVGKGDDKNIVAEFAHGELAYVVRNPRTDWWNMGYGHSELESCLQAVTGLLNAITYNTSIFTNSNIPPGILAMHGNYGEDWLVDFAQTLVQQVGGQNKWHKLPLIFGDADSSMQFQPLRDGQRDDIMWREFMIFMVNVLCSHYHIAAEEINFQAFLTRGGVLTGEGGAERVAFAQETGLHDYIWKVFSTLDRNIVGRFYADDPTTLGPYKIVPTGVGQDDSEIAHQQAIDRLNVGKTSVNEERRQEDRPPFRDPKDPDLWNRIERRALQNDPSLETDPQRLDELVASAYTDLDGELRRWPDLPTNPSMLQARSQEMQEEQGDEGMMPPGMEGMMPGMAPPGPGGEQMPPPGGPQPPGEAPPEEAPEQPPGPEELMKLPIPVEKSIDANSGPPGWRVIDVVLHERAKARREEGLNE